jgi:AbrB family looped-hinge helix DNA binding protein
MATATLTSKGQVTLPREVRANLGVAAGDRLDFVRMDDGNYAIVPAAHSIRSLKGILPRAPKPVSLDDMDAAIRAGATEA